MSALHMHLKGESFGGSGIEPIAIAVQSSKREKYPSRLCLAQA